MDERRSGTNLVAECGGGPTAVGENPTAVPVSSSSLTTPLSDANHQCRPLSRQRWLTSSLTIYATNVPHSERVASSPNHGFRERENTFSVMSNSSPQNFTSNTGRRPFRTLPTLPLTTRAVSPFVVFLSFPPRIRVRVVGSAPFAMSFAYTWSTLLGWIAWSPSPHSTDCRPLSDHSV